MHAAHNKIPIHGYVTDDKPSEYRERKKSLGIGDVVRLPPPPPLGKSSAMREEREREESSRLW